MVAVCNVQQKSNFYYNNLVDIYYRTVLGFLNRYMQILIGIENCNICRGKFENFQPANFPPLNQTKPCPDPVEYL